MSGTPKLNLDPEYLMQLFDCDGPRRLIRFREEPGRPLATELNLQQLYNWYKEAWVSGDLTALRPPLEGCGFFGLQPVVKFVNDWRFEIPDVPDFLVRGSFATEVPGAVPFVVSANTTLRYTKVSRPQLYVFVSHASPDKPLARILVSALGMTHRTFLDEVDIRPGDSIPVKISEALDECHACVLLLSHESICRDWVEREWGSLVMQGKRLVPVLVDIKSGEMPGVLRSIKAVRYEGSLERLVQEVELGLQATLD